ncbi:hypothetical protein [Cupriavidus necator]|uniref:hypothetical protein n=1 Tax=Cupriavidus necator TaxID=106590 RepID=UPI00115FDBC1|nr:hypothetical protein [Cupriavidus necator]
MTASIPTDDIHETASKLAQIAPTFPSGTICCLADLYAKLNAGDWNGIPLPARQQIGIEFRKLIERGPGTTHSNAWLRRVGKNERQQTIYEVVRHRNNR